MSFCHDMKEIFPGLLLGAISDVPEMVRKGADILIVLDRLSSDIWNYGFRGEILFYPVKDGSVLPDDVLDNAVKKITGLLKSGKKVGIFCLSGHGRTGCLASCLLYALGVKEPLEYIRENYCPKAVETFEQEEALRRFMEREA